MDIVVTIPKSEYKNNMFERKEQLDNKDMYGFRVFKNKPKNLNIGDRIYFVRDNNVSYSKLVFDIEKLEDTICEITNRSWGGGYVVKFHKEKDETHLNISCKGFQGYRYKWW